MERQALHRVRHDWGGETEVTTTLIDALEGVVGHERLMELSPLHDHVDPDALDRLFSHTKTAERTRGVVYFDFAEHRVAVHATGDIVIYGS